MDQINTALTDGANLLIVNMVTSGAPDSANEIIKLAGDVPVIFFNRAVDSQEEPDVVLKANDGICFIIGTDAPRGRATSRARWWASMCWSTMTRST